MKGKEARKKIKVAHEAPEPRRPALKLKIRSLQVVLRHAVPDGGAKMGGFVDVQLSLDTYGVWAGFPLFFVSFPVVYDYWSFATSVTFLL